MARTIKTQKTAEQRAADDLAKAQKAAADALADAVRYKAAGKAGAKALAVTPFQSALFFKIRSATPLPSASGAMKRRSPWKKA